MIELYQILFVATKCSFSKFELILKLYLPLTECLLTSRCARNTSWESLIYRADKRQRLIPLFVRGFSLIKSNETLLYKLLTLILPVVVAHTSRERELVAVAGIFVVEPANQISVARSFCFRLFANWQTIFFIWKEQHFLSLYFLLSFIELIFNAILRARMGTQFKKMCLLAPLFR